MRRMHFVIAFVCLLIGGRTARAQNASSQARLSNSKVFDAIIANQEKHVLGVAEAMPAEKYGFAPANGEFKGVRTFAGQLKHIAADLYLDGAAILGENPPGDLQAGENGSSAVRTKPEIIAYVKTAFAYMERATAALDDNNVPIARPDFLPYGPNPTTRLRVAVADVGHTGDHYGQLVEYLRMNGVVPPESRGSAAAKSQAADEQRPIGEELESWINKTAELLAPAADAMPEEKYSFAPSAGEFQGVRTFAEQVKHLAATNYILAAAALGEKPPHGEAHETAPDSVRAKAEIMDYLRGSFAYLQRAAASITAENSAEVIGSRPRGTRAGFIIDALLHSQNHYGQMVEYLRMKGIVPPESRK
jgi:DinB family protein